MEEGVSVLVTTWNGASRLPATLAALAAQRVPDGLAWEVVVVDNASTDGSGDVARRAWPEGAPAPLRVVVEPSAGVLHANLRGLRESRHGLVALVNDDNRPWPDWLARSAADLQAHPEAAAVGARGIAEPEGPLPAWFERFQRHYAVGAQAETGGPLLASRAALWGACTMYRARAWRGLLEQGFAPLLVGPRASARGAGEDYELSYALRLAGWELRHDPALSFRHVIPAAKLDWRWHRRLHRCFGAAIALDAYQRCLEGRGPSPPERAGVAWLAEALRAASALARFAGHFLLGDRMAGDPAVARADQLWGRLVALLRERAGYDRALRAVREAPWRRATSQADASPDGP
ncbi:MAG TPA: glycosyltransferase [Vicinamibacteria bacterium]|nr:glycosyltransferase [Vicinamibacteria bacterium]